MAGPVQLTNETLRKPGELDPSDGIELSVRGTEERHMTHATRIPCYFCGGPATHSREIAGAGKRFACDGCPTKRVAQMKPARRTYPGDIAAYAQFGIAAVVIGAVSWPGFSELVAVSREISDDRYSFAPALLVGFIVLAAFAALTAEAINIVRSRRRQ